MVEKLPIPKSWTKGKGIVPTSAGDKIVEYLRNHQTATHQELVANLRYKMPTIRVTLKYLKNAGMIQVKREGNKILLL